MPEETKPIVEDTKTVETTSVETTTGSPESTIRILGSSVSFRGLLALILVSTLSVLTVMHPEMFQKAFESIAVAVIAFYFGQLSKK